MAFCFRFGHFKYKIMIFKLNKFLLIFQNYLYMGLKNYFDIFVITYFDDISVYSMNKIYYAQYVCLIEFMVWEIIRFRTEYPHKNNSALIK